MIQQLTQFSAWISGKHRIEVDALGSHSADAIPDRIAEALHTARKLAGCDGRTPTLLDYFAAAEKIGLTAQQMADLSRQDLSGFIIARAHIDDARQQYLRTHGITVRGTKLDRCRIVPMTAIELMAMDTTTTMREVEFVAA